MVDYHFGTNDDTSFSTFRFYKKKAFIFGMEIKNASREYLDRYGSTLFEKERMDIGVLDSCALIHLAKFLLHSSVDLAHREEGDLGPVYGFQWWYFGAE